jgi:hypothetical protein
MQVRVVLITPLQVVPQLSAVPVLRLLSAGAAALGEESLDQQLIAPEDGASLSGIELTTFTYKIRSSRAVRIIYDTPQELLL